VLAGEGGAGDVVAALAAGAVGVVSLPTAQAVEGGDARCDALDVELFAEVLETVVLDVVGGTDEVVAPDPENGTNTSAVLGEIVIGDETNAVTIDLLRCNATRDPDFLSADAEIVDGDVTLGGLKWSRSTPSSPRFCARRRARARRRPAPQRT